MTFGGNAGSAVALWESVKNVTVQDCLSLEPRSEIAGYRRHTFFTMGQQTLFLRCWSERGRHDFSVGHCAAGPNAFVACQAHRTHGFSGAIESWASGVLFDNVTIDGADPRLGNRWSRNGGAGWSAANSVIWQSNASEIECFSPPETTNIAVGTWGRPVGDGVFQNSDEFVRPRSLFRGQLTTRLGGGDGAAAHIDPIGRNYVSATNPSLEQAAVFAEGSSMPFKTLKQTILAAGQRDPIRTDVREAGREIVVNPFSRLPSGPAPTLQWTIREGRLIAGDQPLEGKRMTPIWWRGNIRPGEASSFGPAVTRFVPGRYGRGFTDDLEAVAKS